MTSQTDRKPFVPSLGLIFLAHVLLRYPGDDPWAATTMSLVLLGCMWMVARYGGWTSTEGAIAWLRSRPLVAFGLGAATLCMAATLLLERQYFLANHLVAYLIEALFLWYAFLAGGLAFWNAGIASIQSWFRHK